MYKNLIVISLLALSGACIGQGTVVNDMFKVNAPRGIDSRMGKIVSGAMVPYASVSEANTTLQFFRYRGQIVPIIVGGHTTWYWYQDGIADGNLVLFNAAFDSTYIYRVLDSLRNFNGLFTIVGSENTLRSSGPMPHPDRDTDYANHWSVKQIFAYIKSSTAPTGVDTNKTWIDNSSDSLGPWPVKLYYRGKWGIAKYYDPIADYTSQLVPLNMLATGQSNAATRTYLNISQQGDNAPDSRVLLWDSAAYRWTVWNLGTSNNVFFQMAKQIAIQQNRVVRVILSATPGVPISYWDYPSGINYLGLRLQIAQSGIKKIDIVGWWQGESNVNDPYFTYKAEFDTIINRMRKETWGSKQMFVLANGFIDGTIGGASLNTSGPQAYFRSIATLEDNNNLFYNSNNGIYSADALHLNGYGQDTSGARMAAIFINKKTVNGGVFNHDIFVDGGNFIIGSKNDLGSTLLGVDVAQFATSASNNTLVGYRACYQCGTAIQNVMIGQSAGYNNQGGAGNVYIGYQAGSGSTYANNNVGIGWHSLYGSTASSDNFAGGYEALKSLTSGSANVGIGNSNSTALTSGFNNVVVGNNAFVSATSAAGSTILGYGSGQGLTTQNLNTMVGYQTGNSITGGGGNTFLGASITGVPALQSNSLYLAAGGAIRISSDFIESVGIGTGVRIDTSAKLEITSTNRGLLIPRMTLTQMAAIVSPAQGLQIYATDDSCIRIRNGSRWNYIGKSSTYVPTVSNTVNLSASTVYALNYSVNGDNVTVSGRIDITGTTALALTTFNLSIPIASNFTTSDQAGGSGSCKTVQGTFAILSDATNDKLLISFNVGTVTNDTYYFSTTYKIL